MLALILFMILLYQRINLEAILRKYPKLDPKRTRIKANIGLALLGVISILNMTFNIWLDRGLWNGDFFSPFFNNFER